ncbi:hypothetical protein ACIP2X_37960 [Streptomyces sp. NPDC089424]|uniref:hypothetical protein n=1 Tax=Streptomyces sp. NPDC089424 TaxID=3365917 RepID=UPI003814B849
MNKTRIKTNTAQTAANITYYGGTLGAGVGLYNLLNKPDALGFVFVLIVVLTVEGILRTWIDEALDAFHRSNTPATPAAITTEGADR